MKKTSMIAIVGLSAALGAGASFGALGGARQIIRIENGTRVETNLEDGAIREGNTGIEAEEQAERLDAMRMCGPVLEISDGRFSFDSQGEEGYQGEVVVHIDPERSLILDSVSGFPVGLDQLQAGESVYVYASPAMTMSLPPQTTAELVLVNLPQDAAAPQYVTASESLADDGQGGYILKTSDGSVISVPADCPITPYLTRQIVTLEDISRGRRMLVWTGSNKAAEKIVLFNE